MTSTLHRLYFVRFAFALMWATILVATSPEVGPVLTVLLVIYPLVDAAAVLWQLQDEGRGQAPQMTEIANVGISVAVAVALGWTSTESIGAALGVWGAWAVASGATQLATAIQRRRAGGQIPQILSGAISILAGLAFLTQSFQDATSITPVGGYATLGGLFFLVSAIRLTILHRRSAAR
jgi:uncharacterized membrane protein HdeD (DUF308 family)